MKEPTAMPDGSEIFIENSGFGLFIVQSRHPLRPGFASFLPQVGTIVIENSRFFH